MSYIDTFDHELVGFFAGLPLYHPLEVVVGAGGDEFGCTPSQLVLGGSSGEHPAVVLTNPTAAAASFLQAALPPDGPPLSAEAQQFIDELPRSWECLHFAGWGIDDFVAFHERCIAPGFVTPFNAEQDRLVEDWVLRSLGEFVYFSMPELAPDVRAHLADVCARVSGPRYYNVQILPPGYAPPAGRYRAPSGTVIWGNYAWRVDRRTSQ
jgi:hypothetical protein